MPRLPKFIKIGAYTFRLAMRDRLCMGFKKSRNGKKRGKKKLYAGVIDYGGEIIYLDKNLCGAQRYMALWHEIVHGIDALVGMRLCEDATDDFAEAIVQVLIDNPGVIPPARKH